MLSSNSKWLPCFKWMLLVAVLQLVLHLINDYFQLSVLEKDGSRSSYHFVVYFPILLTIFTFWLGIGHVFNCKKEAYAGLVLTLLGLGLNIFVFQRGADGLYPTTTAVLIKLFSFLPYFVFGYLLFKDKRVWTILLFSFVFNSIFLLGFGRSLMDFLNRFLGFFGFDDPLLYKIYTGENSYRYFYPLDAVLKSFSLPVLFLVFSHMVHSLKHQHAYLSGKSIDLSNIYSKKLATVLYLILRFSLIVMLFGVFFHFGNSFVLRVSSKWEMAFSGISIIVSFYLIGLTYRNFLTEYLISRDREISWLYFSWNIPFIGVISWVISLFNLGDIVSLPERIKRFTSAQKNKNGGIQFTIILLLLLVSFDRLMRFSASGSATIVAALGLLITLIFIVWYFSHPSGIWVLIGIVFLQLIYFTFFGESNKDIGNSAVFFTNISNVVVLFSLFHLAYLRNEAALPDPVIEDDLNQEGLPIDPA